MKPFPLFFEAFSRCTVGAFVREKHGAKGFTLVELLVVMAIIAIVAALSISSVSGLLSSGNVNSTVSGISQILNQSRAYAMAHNTYVWVGFSEDASAQTLAVATVAGITGSSSDLGSTTTYSPISRVQTFANFTITTVAQVQALNKSLTGLWTSGTDLVGSSSTTFSQTANGAPVSFKYILQFDPQGEADVTSGGALPHWIQFGLQPVRGGNLTSPNVAAIQVARLSGGVQVFRP